MKSARRLLSEVLPEQLQIDLTQNTRKLKDKDDDQHDRED